MTPSSTQSDEKWITTDIAAQYLGVHPEVVKRWCRQGRLRGPGVGKAGRVYRFKTEALDRFLELNAKHK